MNNAISTETKGNDDDLQEVARLLAAYEAGDQAAFNRLLPLVYPELRRLARSHLRRRPGDLTLNTTGLVHEAYVKLARSPELRLYDHGHLMAVTARVMRQVLVSQARSRLRAKRGSGVRLLEFDEAQHGGGGDAEGLLDSDCVLRRMRETAPDLADIFECRYLGGMSEEETARALELSLRTVQRGWLRARVWLRVALEAPSRPAPHRREERGP